MRMRGIKCVRLIPPYIGVAKSFLLQQLYQLLFVHIRILHPIARRGRRKLVLHLLYCLYFLYFLCYPSPNTKTPLPH